MKVKVTEKSK